MRENEREIVRESEKESKREREREREREIGVRLKSRIDEKEKVCDLQRLENI